MSSADDLFASLNGSLMKDLLADLQGGDDDGGWLSLEQLEQELSHLETPSMPTPAPSHEPYSAASMVVQHAQSVQTPTHLQQQPPPPPPPMDAWTLSMQKFTATSLEQDFLHADTARKQAAKAPSLDFSAAEEYDVAEKAQFVPPPGMMAPAKNQSLSEQELLSQAANKLLTQLQSAPAPDSPPPRHDLGALPTGLPKPAFTPQNSISVSSHSHGAVPATPPPSTQVTPAPVKMIVPPTSNVTPPMPIPAAIPVAVPVRGVPAWQSPPPPPPPPLPVMPHPVHLQPPPPPRYVPPSLFCNPNPRAMPIPAQHVQSRYMKARDISYVVHSIMKPLLLEGIGESDYDIRFYQRRAGSGPDMAATPKGHDKFGMQMTSRQTKSKEWSTEHSTLGHVTKSNVTRPRALIAHPPVDVATTTNEQKNRASLWKARIYCDQAYQAYFQVLEGWRSNQNVQAHYVRLFKCFGVMPVEGKFQVDTTPLELLLKLDKGRVLLARILEQAMLPPNAVQALTPAVVQVLEKAPNDILDDRVFVALSRVVHTLAQLQGTTLTACLKAMGSKEALSSATRMQFVHTILHRGAAMAAHDEEFHSVWAQAEAEFTKVLAEMG